MIRTQIPISVWESEGDTVINTAIQLLNDQDQQDHQEEDDLGEDGQTVEQWRAMGLMP